MLQNKPNSNIPKGYVVLTEEFIPQGFFKKELKRFFYIGNSSFEEILPMIRRHHNIKKSSFSEAPKKYLLQTSTESKIFTIY